MRAVSTFTAALAIGTAFGLVTPSAQAVGFGRVTNSTQLGQPLNFTAAVRLEPDELLARECISAEVQSGDNLLHPQQVRITLEGADLADRSVRITTTALIDEPVVTVSVTLGCGAKVTRRFVAFVDPPLINAAQTAPVDAAASQRGDSQLAPIVTLVQAASAPAASGRRTPRADAAGAATGARPRGATQVVAADTSRQAREPAPSGTDRPRRAAARSRQPSVARAAPAGARLQLETAAPVVARAAPTPASAPITVAATAALPAAALPASAANADEAAQALAKERQRIQSLEDGLAKLRADSLDTRASLLALQARLKGAETERYANPLVYLLALLVALLALALAALWWRQSRTPQVSQWWAGPAPEPATSNAALAAVPGEPVLSAPVPLAASLVEADAFAVPTFIEEDELPPVLVPQVAATAGEMPRALSVEELIDLEQQAEFFVVLGQDEAAIELLMTHVRNDGGISPLPYLKLLEIYRRRGEGDAYERIRERFNRRFNAYAPDWNSDLQRGRTLEDYADTIVQLQQLWNAPARAMETLDASLFRRDQTEDTFDLPAYRELLFLYSIARDLAEHAGALPSASVDLLLPFDDAGEAPIARLSASTHPDEALPGDMMTIPLDLDVSFGPAKPAVETTPSALQRTSAAPVETDISFLDFNLDQSAKPPKAGGGR